MTVQRYCSCMMTITCRLATLTVVLVAGSGPAPAQVVTSWTGDAGTTAWNTAGNWSSGLPSNTLNSTTTIALPDAVVTTPAAVSIRTLTVSGDLSGGGAAPTLNISQNFGVAFATFSVGSAGSGSNFQGIVNHTAGAVNITGASTGSRLRIAAAAAGGSSGNQGSYFLDGASAETPATLTVQDNIGIGGRPGEFGLLSLAGHGSVSTGSLDLGVFNGSGELRVRGGELTIGVSGGFRMSPSGAGSSVVAATLTDSGTSGFSPIAVGGNVQFDNNIGGNNISFTLALDSWVSSGVGQVVTVLDAAGLFTGHGVFGNVANDALLTRSSGQSEGSPSYTLRANYGIDPADSRTKFQLTVTDADLTWDDAAANGIWGTGASDAGFTGSRWVPGADVTFGATGAGAVTVSGTQTVKDLAVAADGYSFSGGGLALNSIGGWSIANNTVIASPLSATGGFDKTGAGLLTLSGSNSYDDATIVSAGGLLVNGSHAGLGLVSVAAAARVGGTGSLAGDLTIASGGLFVFNPLATLDVAGAVTLDDSFGVASLVNADGSATDWSSVADGTYTLIGTTASTFDNITNFGSGDPYVIGAGRSAYFTNGSLQLVIVPEPAAVALAAAGIGLFAVRGFQRRRPRSDWNLE